VSEPAGRAFGRAIFSAPLLPFTLGSSLAHYSVDFVRDDSLPLQRRQALVQWERFSREHPDAPEVAELGPQIESYQQAWRETQAARAKRRAEDALDANLPDAAWIYAQRARRYVDSDDARALVANAEERIAQRERVLASAVGYGGPGDAEALGRERGPLLAALGDGSGVAAAPPDARLVDEERYLHANQLGRAGDDGAMWQELEALADESDSDSAMARHAQALRADPERNPYHAFARARSKERRSTTRWVLLGPLTARPDRGALGMLEYVLDLPWRIQGAALLPVRLIQLPWRESTPGAAATAVHARTYLALFPRGEHAEEVRDWLLEFERDRENWVGALRVAEGDPDASDAELDVLRESAAEQALHVASDEKRSDLRARLLANVVRAFPETRAAAEAGRAAREQATERTTHSVQLSRGFLLENRDVAGPGGLDLAPALLDGDPSNGELHPDGVTLVGGRELEIAVLAESGDEDDPPRKLAEQLSEPDLARLVARLEETNFRNSLLDEDDAIDPNAQRDVVFERARIGLADDVDERPSAEARYAYRGMRERYGMVRSREALIPVELVVQGSLSDLTLGAFPRLRPPKTTPDAVLYKD
jgi:tetratricopeptide (TPR) repeat protein